MKIYQEYNKKTYLDKNIKSCLKIPVVRYYYLINIYIIKIVGRIKNPSEFAFEKIVISGARGRLKK